MIYLMASMRIPARMFTVGLALWLSTAWALPTCCWSMALPVRVSTAASAPLAHHHEPTAADPHAHHQAHRAPRTAENASPPARAVAAARDARDCATERDVALAATGGSSSFKWAHATDEAAPPDALVLRAADRARASQAPPPPVTSAPCSAFLSPLRI